jgi:hypothetical protein
MRIPSTKIASEHIPWTLRTRRVSPSRIFFSMPGGREQIDCVCSSLFSARTNFSCSPHRRPERKRDGQLLWNQRCDLVDSEIDAHQGVASTSGRAQLLTKQGFLFADSADAEAKDTSQEFGLGAQAGIHRPSCAFSKGLRLPLGVSA